MLTRDNQLSLKFKQKHVRGLKQEVFDRKLVSEHWLSQWDVSSRAKVSSGPIKCLDWWIVMRCESGSSGELSASFGQCHVLSMFPCRRSDGSKHENFLLSSADRYKLIKIHKKFLKRVVIRRWAPRGVVFRPTRPASFCWHVIGRRGSDYKRKVFGPSSRADVCL